MMGDSFSNTLEVCLVRLDRGESLLEVLADFPDLEEQLRPLLLVAMASRAFPVPVPGQAAQRLGRNQMLAEMNSLEIKRAFRKNNAVPFTSRLIGGLVSAARRRGFGRLAYSYRLAMVSLVVLLSGGFLTLSASASSQPGDLLYSLKLSAQRTGLMISQEQEDPDQTYSDPAYSDQSLQVFTNLYNGYQNLGARILDTYSGEELANADGAADISVQDDMGAALDDEDLKDAEKDLKEEEKEAEKDLKDAEKEEEKDLKEEEKEEKEDEKEEEKEEKEDEKEEEKEEKEDEKEEEKEEKEDKKIK